MIVVTGATGQLGRLVLKALLEKTSPSRVIAAVRSPDKAQDLKQAGVQVRAADYDRPETLAAAFAGAEKVLLISGNTLGKRVSQHRAVIDAARKAGVQLFAYTSVLKAPTTALMVGPDHRETEAAITASGLPSVVLRNGWYSENYLFRAAGAVKTGVLLGCAGEGRISAAPRADYAQAAATVLTSPNQAGRTYELAGDQSFTLAELAAELSRQIGRPMRYQNVTESEFTEALERNGIPSAYAPMMARSDALSAQGALLETGRQLSQLLGRATTPIGAVIEQAIRAGQIPKA
ncbi:MAG TPA: SDR family oxidoreductase [Stellaceae bacterium]|nr:SDR family oxidoreductase [Stellaceae bacterium]